MSAPEDRPEASEPPSTDSPDDNRESPSEQKAAASVAATELDLEHGTGAEDPVADEAEPKTVRPARRGRAGNADIPPVARSKVTLRQATLTSEQDSERAQTPSVDAYVGYIIDGRYHIKKQLAQGGMGVVYQARHRIIDKLVAVKILRPELVHDREITRRFLTEAQAASAIGSEHIVDVTDYGELPDGATYIVMEYLEGQSLTNRVRAEEPLALHEVLAISRQLAEGLARAHAAGIIHRDLKPDNVLLVERGKRKDFVKILDFGIAKVASSQNQITRAGKIFGTPHYMSPEQAKGEELDRRTDIYSLGVMLYEMAAQRLPFEAENPLGVLTQHMYVEPVPLHQVCAREIPVGLEAIIMKCISKAPDERYSSMLELEEDLARVDEGLDPLALEDLARSQRTPESLRSRIETTTGVSPTAGIAIGALVAIALGAASYWSRTSTPALEATTTAATSTSATTATASASSAANATPDESKVVALVLSPVDARVYRGRNDLGPMPLSIRLRPGQRMQLDVRRPGYRSKTISIDGSEPRKVVELEPIPGAARGAVPTALPDPAAARTISFVADAGTLVSPAAHAGRSKRSPDAGARHPRRGLAGDGTDVRPVPTVPELHSDSPRSTTPPPGPRPRAPVDSSATTGAEERNRGPSGERVPPLNDAPAEAQTKDGNAPLE
jgi:serine/threonine-protein kinase